MDPAQKSDEPIADLQRRNADLNALVGRFLADTDRVFASRTWRIGYAVADMARRVQRLLGNRSHQIHIDAAHFRRLADNCYAYGFRAAAVATAVVPPAEDGIPEIPANYVLGDVETAIRDLWDKAGKERARHAS